MRLIFVKVQDGKRHFLWHAFFGFTVLAYLTMIGAAEVFWKLFTGGYSPLVGLFALFLATLVVVRRVIESFSLPVHVIETWLDR